MVGVTDMDVTEGMDTGVIEGGDMECFPLCQPFSVSVLPSTGYIPLGKLTIVTGTGKTITKTLAIAPGILGEQDSTITLQISGTVSTPQLTGSDGDDL